MAHPDHIESAPSLPPGMAHCGHTDSSPPPSSGTDAPGLNRVRRLLDAYSIALSTHAHGHTQQVVVPIQLQRTLALQRVTDILVLMMTFMRHAGAAAFAGTVTVICYAIRIIVSAFSFLTLPLVAFLAGLCMVSFVSFGIAALWRSAQAAIVSFDVCKLPMVCSTTGLASLDACNLPLIPAIIPSCAALPVASVGRADFAGLLAIQHRAFDELVVGSTTNSELVVNVKHAELAVRDLVILVKASNLTTKEPLADTLSLFSVDARRTGRGLQVLMSKIHGTIDR